MLYITLAKHKYNIKEITVQATNMSILFNMSHHIILTLSHYSLINRSGHNINKLIP